MTDAPRYWAVEFDDTGKVIRCERVFSERASSARCFVVEASSEKDARAAAYQLYRSRQRLLVKERRAAYVAQGRCRCGRPKDSDEYAWCELCRRSHKQHRDARKQGQTVTGAERGLRIAAARRTTQDMTRLGTLLEVAAWWRDARTPDEFARRLATEIQRLEQPVAAE